MTEFETIRKQALSVVPDGYCIVEPGKAEPTDLVWHRYAGAWVSPPPRDLETRNRSGDWYAVVRKVQNH